MGMAEEADRQRAQRAQTQREYDGVVAARTEGLWRAVNDAVQEFVPIAKQRSLRVASYPGPHWSILLARDTALQIWNDGAWQIARGYQHVDHTLIVASSGQPGIFGAYEGYADQVRKALIARLARD
jgi:hypothetical protein